MKRLIILLTLLSNIALADTKQELAHDIFTGLLETSEIIAELPNAMAEQKERYVELFKPRYNDDKIPQEILGKQEALYNDVVSSNIFELEVSALESVFVKDLIQNFTVEELVEFRAIINRPIFKKLRAVRTSLASNAQQYLEEWDSKNKELSDIFMSRNKEILNEKISLMKRNREQ